MIVKLDGPPNPKPKKGDVVILHPAYQSFLDFLAEAAVKQWLRDNAAAADTAGKATKAKRRHRARKPKDEGLPKLDYEVITVDEAIARFNLTRAEIMAQFDDVMRKWETSKAAKSGPDKP